MPPVQISPESSPFKAVMEFMSPILQPIIAALRFVAGMAWSNHEKILQMRQDQLEESNLRTLQHCDTMMELFMLRREVADLKGLVLILIGLVTLLLVILAILHLRVVP
jgi:hypothetical protein